MPDFNLPNLVILGFPKSGTTALHAYLSGHPRISMSSPKEMWFFGQDLKPWSRARDLERYRECFPDKTDALYWGEATPHYIYSRNSMTEIKRQSPEAKVLVIVRDPGALLVAYHADLLATGTQKERDLNAAWKNAAEGQFPKSLGMDPRMNWILDYRRIVSLRDSIDRALGIFGVESCLLLRLEELANHPRAIYQRVMAFLGLEDDGRTDFPRMNSRKKVRYPWLMPALASTARSLGRVRRSIPALDGLGRLRLGGRILKMNTVSEGQSGLPVENLDPEIQHCIDEERNKLREFLGFTD